MSTPISAAVPYATVQDLLDLIDWRVISDYVGDEGQRFTLKDAQTPGTVPYQRIYKALGLASGEVEAGCLRGNRYSVADLQAVNGNSQQLLVKCVVSLAVGEILDRRADLQVPTPARVEQARLMLAALESGEAIFALQEEADAGLPSHEIEGHREVSNLNLSSFILRRYFGRRANLHEQLPD